MKTLHISVLDKIATYLKRDGDIVCGNSDYQIEFTFDSEWNDYPSKTARFIINGKYVDVAFLGTVCPVPMIINADTLQVGAYAGDLTTTTSATIPCKKSILCEGTESEGFPIPIVTKGDSVFVRYSAYPNGTGLTEKWSEGQNYIGFATGQTAPTDKTAYTWSKFVGGNVGHTITITFELNARSALISTRKPTHENDYELCIQNQDPITLHNVTELYVWCGNADGVTVSFEGEIIHQTTDDSFEYAVQHPIPITASGDYFCTIVY